MMRWDILKNYKKLVAVCLGLTVLNLLYAATHSARKLPTKIIYFKDPINKVVVVQDKYNLDVLEDRHGYIPPEIYDPARHKGYNIYTINTYDYLQDTKNAIDIVVNRKKVSDVIKLDFEMQFAREFSKFFTQLMTTIESCNPQIGPINNNEHYAESKNENKYQNRDGRIPLYGGHLRENYLVEEVRTKEFLSYFLRLSVDEVNSLGVSNDKFLNSMPTNLPPGVMKNINYNDFMKGDGIVYLGGGDYDQLSLLSIKMLRSSGSKLPIELIIPKKSDFDPELCLRILPSLNARCKVMEDYLPPGMIDKIGGYQLKNVALLICSYQRVLYLDADNIPARNPDHLFVNEPFISNSMVIWPDLWRRSTSPLFYLITDIPTDPNKRMRKSYFNKDMRSQSDEVSFHDAEGTIPEASSETGQILIDKSIHFKTLILSMYFNYYGPDYYYALLSQGAAGEGDKETFIAAAHKLKLPYYQVKEFNREFGPLEGGKRHALYGMGQYDPILDHIQDKAPDKFMPKDFVPDYAIDAKDKDHANYHFHYFKSSSLMFLHANWPKLKLREMFIANSFGRGPKKDDLRRRLYQSNLIDECGFDLELHLFQSMKWLYCDLDINLASVPLVGTEDRTKICQQISEQIVFLSTHS